MSASKFNREAILEMRPSRFAPLQSLAEVDALVQSSLLEDFLPLADAGLDDYNLDRLGSAIFYRIPLLTKLSRDLASMNAIELGCGPGMKAIPWSRFFKTYVAVDINASAIARANEYNAIVKRKNLAFFAEDAFVVASNPHQYGLDGDFDCLILYAVLEHLTLAERKQVLLLAASILKKGGLVIVAETPNRLIPFDNHGTFLHFFQSLPTELALEYVSKSPRLEARKIAATNEETLYRFGQGVSFHEFETWMQQEDCVDLSQCFLADGWDMWCLFDEPFRADEVWLSRYLASNLGSVAPGYSRYWIEAVFGLAAPTDLVKRQPTFPAPLEKSLHEDRRNGKYYANARYTVTNGEKISFAVDGAKEIFLNIDVANSAGALAILDENSSELVTLDVHTLRRSYFPRWHSNCVVDLSALKLGPTLSIHPQGENARLSTTGVICR